MAQKQPTKATKQAMKGVSPRSGVAPPAERQFGKPNGNPRHNGAWKKEDSARYKLEMMTRMTEAELMDLYADKSAPFFERKIARCIKDGDWNTIASMFNQIYGYPKQAVETVDLTPPPPLSPRKAKKKCSKIQQPSKK